MDETPLFTKKRRNSLKNPRKGFFKWLGEPSDKEQTFSGQQSSELLATEAVYLIDTFPALSQPQGGQLSPRPRPWNGRGGTCQERILPAAAGALYFLVVRAGRGRG